ncbi:uncharacterized protein [Anabrus simplex]|uniref:uncharacterized protein n=1 Tax=Anabrus simplex TaxID=316456 RepID=UPI0035A3D49B
MYLLNLAMFTIISLGGAQEYYTAENLVIYPLPSVSLKHIHQTAGIPINLNCSTQEKQKLKHKWTWQKCSTMDQRWPMCSQWTTICKSCSSILRMNNATSHQSGIYRCIHDVRTMLVLFHLEIKEPQRPPELPEVSPNNLTVLEGMPAVFHCRVLSEQYVDLRWLLRLNGMTNDSEHIVYQGVHYKPLKSTGQVRQGTMYYTKLSLSRTTLLDSGCYMCVALSQTWSTAKDIQLTVLPNNISTDSALGYEDSSWSLHLLFLIPAALALLPASAWLCCHWRRRFKRQQMPALIQPTKYQIVGNNNSIIHLR